MRPLDELVHVLRGQVRRRAHLRQGQSSVIDFDARAAGLRHRVADGLDVGQKVFGLHPHRHH